MGDVYDCDYCGTPVTDKESGPLETSTGRRHYDSVCREYVFAVKESYRKEASSLTAQLAAYAARLAKLESAVPHPGDGSCDICGRAPALSNSVTLCEDHDPDALVAQLAARDAGVVKLKETARAGWESARLLSIALGRSHATEERADRELDALLADAAKGET